MVTSLTWEWEAHNVGWLKRVSPMSLAHIAILFCGMCWYERFRHSSDVQFRVARIKSTAANALEIVRLCIETISPLLHLACSDCWLAIPKNKLHLKWTFTGECGKPPKLPKVSLLEVHSRWHDCSLGPFGGTMYHKVSASHILVESWNVLSSLNVQRFRSNTNSSQLML